MLDSPLDKMVEHWKGSYPAGWDSLVYRIFKHASSLEGVTILPAQIKEKFGRLRFYYDVSLDSGNEVIEKEFSDYVWNMETFSGYVCQDCGTTVDVTTGPLDPTAKYGWILTLCGKCRTYNSMVKDLSK